MNNMDEHYHNVSLSLVNENMSVSNSNLSMNMPTTLVFRNII